MELQASFCFLFFTFTAVFSLFSLSLFILRLKPCCNCDVCTAFINRSWAAEFVNLSDWYTHLLRKSPTGTIHLHVLNNIITANPDNVEYMIKTNFDNYPKGKAFSAILGDLLGRGIFNVDGNCWRFQRKMASLELGSLSIRSHALSVVVEEIESRLIPFFSSVADKDGDVLDLQDIFRRFSFDSICKFSFGLDPGSLKPSLPVSDLESAFDLSSKLCAERGLAPTPLVWKMKRLFNLGSEKKLKESIKIVKRMADQVIKTRRVTGPSSNNDLLSRFMGSISDDDYLRDIVISFLLAGRDTVASALTSFFLLLSQNPKVVEKIREESDRVMGTTLDTLASFGDLRHLHYLRAALHESMRLYPPVQFDSKFAEQDDVLPDGTFVRRGSRVTYHPYAMGRMERIWGPDSLEFKPDRWIRDGMFKPESAYKYPVYQGGVRVCLGKEMSLMEMQIASLSLIRRFDVRVVNPSQTLRFSPGLTANVSGGLPAVVRRRDVPE
ncbi:cytochrome P450 94C1 [Cynara cardunculus var. scolymus]|uniref:Cytochrome P450 n=1 Tax=Cynara cardunculus var. scolymus TaxID=59895 RepID=A0A103XHC0_CYNCS|nr:cytochrome P450 94C1 [Cynara cardunculus var. scolymus]KVH90707.1 cytochrome P450 [Cynara cardunculus var. scolymus]